MSSFETFTQRWRSGSAIIDSISARFASSASARRPSSPLGLAQAHDERVANALQLARRRARAARRRPRPATRSPGGGRRRRRARRAFARAPRSGGAGHRERALGGGLGDREPPLPPSAGGARNGVRAGDSRGCEARASPDSDDSNPAARPAASQIASSTAMSGTPGTRSRTRIVRLVFGWTPRPSAVAPKSSATGRASSAITSVPGRQLAGPALERPRRPRSAGCPGDPDLVGVEAPAARPATR